MPKVLGRAALVAGGLLVGLAVGEVLARAFGPEFQVVFRESIQASDDPVLIYGLRPGAPDRNDRISADGLRDREHDRMKPAGVIRIAAIGDSITFGNGVRRDASWPKHLETLLGERRAADGVRFEVLNFGVPGYNVEQVAERLRSEALAFDPDLVIYGYSLNDPQASSVEADALRTLQDAYRGSTEAGLARWLAHSRLFLLSRQVAFERAKPELIGKRPPLDPGFEAQKRGAHERYFREIHTEDESAARFHRGLDALAAVAAEHHLPVLVVIFPLFGDGDGGPESVADVHELVRTEAARRGFAVLDLLPVYTTAKRATGDDLSVDFMHPNPLGHRVAANALLAWMCRAQWLPKDSVDCARAPADPVDRALAQTLQREWADEAPMP